MCRLESSFFLTQTHWAVHEAVSSDTSDNNTIAIEMGGRQAMSIAKTKVGREKAIADASEDPVLQHPRHYVVGVALKHMPSNPHRSLHGKSGLVTR